MRAMVARPTARVGQSISPKWNRRSTVLATLFEYSLL
jgi:hypothetical protein